MNSVLRSSMLVTQRCTCFDHRIFSESLRGYGDKGRPIYAPENDGAGRSAGDQTDSLDDIAEPTNCCMSGCTNCVWIQYAERLSNTLQRSDVDVQKVIIEKIQDPNMRAFLTTELRCRQLVK